MPGSKLFNLGLYQKRFGGNNIIVGPSINLGCTRGRGSSTRMFNYCTQSSSNPSECINQFITVNQTSSSAPVITAPSAPTITNIVSIDPNQLTITFTEPTSDGGSAIIDYQYSVDGGVTFIAIDSISNPLNIYNIQAGGYSNILLAAVNEVGRGATSNPYISSVTVYGWSGLPNTPINGLTGSVNLLGIVRCSCKDENNDIIYYAGASDLALKNSNGTTTPVYGVIGYSPSQSSWLALYPFYDPLAYGGSYNGINAIAIDTSGNFYIGGDFSFNNGTYSFQNIAKYTTAAEWVPLSGGVSGPVYNIAINSSNNVYVGGVFTSANGVTVNNIAMWNGNTWSALGSGTSGGSGGVNTIAIDSSDNVYVGGGFINAGGLTVNRIAMWDPSGVSWSSLDEGVNNFVKEIAIDTSNNVYFGGDFTIGSGIALNYIAKWDKSLQILYALTPTGGTNPGLNRSVRSLSIDNNNVYIGGVFNHDNNDPGITLNHIAKWDGNNFSALGNNGVTPGNIIDGTIYVKTIQINNNGLFCGGTFTGAGQCSNISNVAQYTTAP